MPSFRRWLRRLAPALLVVPLLAGASPLAVLAQDVSELDKIAADTAEVRELPPLESLEPVFLTPDEAQAEIEALMREDWDAEGIAAAVRSLAALGLLPADIDLLQLNIDLLGEQAGGYYDPETGHIVVIQSADFGAMGAFIYSHEITHALQDAHLGLGDLMDVANEELTDDGILASVALYEGDASLAAALYVARNPLLALQLGAQLVTGGEEVETAVLDAAPPLMALGLVFPYFDGLTFVQALYDEGGWDAVNAAYTNPPASTEQIMHVEQYRAGDAPVEVALPDPAEVLGAGWEAIDDNTLGEFQTAVMLANLAPGEGINDLTGEYTWPEEVSAAAAGWGGDRYQLWSNGEEDAFVWQSVWDSEADAEEFFAAFRAYEEERFGAFTAATGTDLTLEADGRVVRLILDGDTVRYVQAATAAQADHILSALAAPEAAAA